MPTKPKTPQPQTPESRQERDYFQTPNYATDLLIPYLPKGAVIWECAAGGLKISNRLKDQGFDVISSDIESNPPYSFPFNFLHGVPSFSFDVIVTNPAFSIKRKFFDKCKEYKKPFALLMPADRSQWVCNAIKYDGAQWITPNRRIDYLTPNILQRIYEGETSRAIRNHLRLTLKQFKGQYKTFSDLPADLVLQFACHLYQRIDQAPARLLAEYSASQFHSAWLTVGLGLPYQETIIDLSPADKLNI